MKIRFSISLLFVIILFVLGLVWLAFNVILMITLFFCIIKVTSLIKKTLIKKIVKSFFYFILIIVISINLKLFAFDLFKIPSGSMKNTLFTNDVIVVNKLKYGPRLPRSPFDIPLINIAYYFNENARKKIKKYWWSYKRLSGTTSIKQGDVMVFNSSWSKDFILVKRCLALAGDTLFIKDGEVYTNSVQYKSPLAVKNDYRFIVKDKTNLHKILDSLSLNHITFKRNRKNVFTKVKLSRSELKKIKTIKGLDSLQIAIDTFNVKKKIFAKLPNKKWTFDNMGPIIIPKKNMQIELNPETFSLYKRVIKKSEHCNIENKSGVYFINDRKTTTYTFKQDYYFMMGDNRKETLDSRAWGFVPEENIIGKVQCVLSSNYQDKFQWNRLFKTVN